MKVTVRIIHPDNRHAGHYTLENIENKFVWVYRFYSTTVEYPRLYKRIIEDYDEKMGYSFVFEEDDLERLR